MAYAATTLMSLLALGGQAASDLTRQYSSYPKIGKGDGDLVSFAQRTTGDSPLTQSVESPVVLQPVRPSSKAGKKKRDSQSPFDLLEEDTLYWAGEDGTIAELWLEMAGKSEAFVDIEYFGDRIESISCPQDGAGKITIDFVDENDLGAASQIWNWVSEDPSNSFVIMIGAGDCGWNTERVLYSVQGLDFDSDTKTVLLQSDHISWKQAIHSYDLNIGKAALHGNQTSLARRGWFEDLFNGVINVNPDLSVPFNIDLSGTKLPFDINGVSISGSCSNCLTSGSFDVEAQFRVRLFEIEEAWVELSTPGVNSVAIIDINVQGDFTDTLFEGSLTLFKASPAGISIPNILTIGPTVGVSLSAGVSAIKGNVTVTVGGTSTIPPSTARLDFLNEQNTKSEGWTPIFEPTPFKADASVQVTATAALNAAVGLEISALETGFVADLEAKLPYVTAALKALLSTTCTACEKFQTAVEGSINIGISVGVALKQKIAGSLTNLWSLQLYDAKIPVVDFCEAVGPQPETCSA
ncbi:unnamed protein product [Clonostachys rosea f. rosea IK726]|uniref:Uncharacterized protein n=1 Tax=Clonostachys rosea f. rosea IK726 TaxID=1349383 RepID=A0ACA9UTB6_BIOOC|nr:unnamed protein product [Clonostachys rosea f. rosea IK726]